MITIKINVQNVAFSQQQLSNKCPPYEVHFHSLLLNIICRLINNAFLILRFI